MSGPSAVMVETPSGKGARDENFPVGSWLLHKHLRPQVAAFYAFARAIDDIADNPALSPDDKIARLSGFDDVLCGRRADATGFDPTGFDKAARLRDSLQSSGVAVDHGRALIDAFKQDAVKQRYRDWDELVDYCDRSAAPVGRYLLDLHGEDRSLYAPVDALCNALQVLNHVQDCGDDRRALDRVYLPLDWMAAEGVTVAALDAKSASPGLRRVIDRALDGVDALLSQAASGPARIGNRRLAMETAAILEIAQALSAALRRRDPLAGRVKLSRARFAWCVVRGVTKLLT